MKLQDLLSKQKKTRFYIMHLSYGQEEDGDKKKELWGFSEKKRLIGLDLVDYVDGSWPIVKDSVIEALRRDFLYVWIWQFDTFCKGMSPSSMDRGDIVLVLDGFSSILGIAQVTSDHDYRPALASKRGGNFFDHVRQVKWMYDYGYDKPLEIPALKGFVNTLGIVEKDSKRWSQLINIELDQ